MDDVSPITDVLLDVRPAPSDPPPASPEGPRQRAGLHPGRGRDPAHVGRPRVHRRPVSAVERQHRARPQGTRRRRLGADGEAGLRLGLCRVLQRAGDPAGGAHRRPGLRQHGGGLFHHRGRRIQRKRVQVRPLLLEADGQAGQGEDRLAPLRLSRRHHGGDERHQPARLPEDVRPAGAGVLPGRAALPLSLARQRRRRDRRRRRLGGRRSTPMAPTPSPPSSASR